MATTLEARVEAPELVGPVEAVSPRRRWSGPRRFALVVGAAVLVAFALRVAIGLTDDAASTDETAYLRSGMSLVDGDGFQRDGRPELHFPPFVPFLLGLASHVFDDPHTGTVAMTVAAGTAIVVPLALLGRHLAGPTAGAIVAWVAAVAPGLSTMPQIRGTGSETEYTLLLVTATWLVASAGAHRGRARTLRITAAGLMVGLAYLTRPEGLFIAGPLGVAVLVLALRARPPGARVRSAVVHAGAFALPILVCVAPYVAYLHQHTGGWQLTGKTQDASIEAWQAVARSDREERNRILYALDESGLRFSATYASLPSLARDDPSGYVTILGTNVGNLFETTRTWTLLPLPLWPLAVLGAWRRRRSGVVPLVLAVGALPVATALVFFVQPRYLLVTIALAAVLVGVGLASFDTRVRRVATVAVVGLMAAHALLTFRGEVAGWGHPVEQAEQRRAGEWVAENTDPDARVMTRSMIVEFYGQRPTVAIPHASYDEIMRFARHYGVEYFVADWYTADRLIPSLEPLLTQELPGLRLVHEVEAERRVARVFALDPVPPPSDLPPPPLGFTGDGG